MFLHGLKDFCIFAGGKEGLVWWYCVDNEAICIMMRRYFPLVLALCLAGCTKIMTVPEVETRGSEVASDRASVTLSGAVVDDGNDDLTDCGICYVTGGSTTPTVSDACLRAAVPTGGKGSFRAVLEEVRHNVDYSYRAYAVNRLGTAYGDVQTFRVDAHAPVVTTEGYTMGANQVMVDGNVTNPGELPVTECGLRHQLWRHAHLHDACADAHCDYGHGHGEPDVVDGGVHGPGAHQRCGTADPGGHMLQEGYGNADNLERHGCQPDGCRRNHQLQHLRHVDQSGGGYLLLSRLRQERKRHQLRGGEDLRGGIERHQCHLRQRQLDGLVSFCVLEPL